MIKDDVVCPRCHEQRRIRRNGRSTSGMQRYRCQSCFKTFQIDFYYLGSSPDIQKVIVDMAQGGSNSKDTARALGINLKTVVRYLKNTHDAGS